MSSMNSDADIGTNNLVIVVPANIAKTMEKDGQAYFEKSNTSGEKTRYYATVKEINYIDSDRAEIIFRVDHIDN